MLVVAMPKSASTALLRTLAERHRLQGHQVLFHRRPWPMEFQAIARWHSDMRVLGADDVGPFANPAAVYKQHIVPTDAHLALLADTPKVVLLRDPVEVIAAYRRAERATLSHPRPEFFGLDSLDEWIARAEEIGALDELRRFRDRWQAEGSQVVTYDELVNEVDSVFDVVEDAFSLDRTARPVQLRQERFSRNPKRSRVRTRLRRLGARLR